MDAQGRIMLVAVVASAVGRLMWLPMLFFCKIGFKVHLNMSSGLSKRISSYSTAYKYLQFAFKMTGTTVDFLQDSSKCEFFEAGIRDLR